MLLHVQQIFIITCLRWVLLLFKLIAPTFRFLLNSLLQAKSFIQETQLPLFSTHKEYKISNPIIYQKACCYIKKKLS